MAGIATVHWLKKIAGAESSNELRKLIEQLAASGACDLDLKEISEAYVTRWTQLRTTEQERGARW